MKINSLRLTVFALGLLVAAGGILINSVQAATYTHTFYNATVLSYTNSVDTHTMDPRCDGSSPTSYNWSLTVNGTSISGTHSCPVLDPAPTGLTVIPQACSTGQNGLDWNDSPGAASYSVYLSDNTWLGNSIGSNFTHTGTMSTTYSYYVRSNNAAGVQSAQSAVVSGTTATGCLAPTISLSASPTTIDPGDSSTLTWTVSGATSCTASGGWSGAKAAGGGSEVVSPVVTTTYNLSCTGVGGTTNATPVVVTSPSGFISASTCTIVPSGATEGTGCDVIVNWGAYDFAGAPSVRQGATSFSSSPSGSQTRTVDPDDRSFTLRDTGGTFTDSATANVTCQTGTIWSTTSSHCAFLPIVGISYGTNLIRSGATLDFEISVNSNFDLNCTVRDGGAAQTFSHVASAATQAYPRITRPLTSAQVVSVSCVSPLDPTINGSDEVRVNVIPTIQEI